MKKWVLVGLLSFSLVSCQDSGKKDLEQRVQTLERENAALKAERDALKAQLGVAAIAAQGAQDSAMKAAAESYARRCATSLAIVQVDSPSMTIPTELEGKACDDPAMGENVVTRQAAIAGSRIHLLDGGERFTVTVTNANGGTFEYSSP